jgi:hypothetical protein
VKAGRRSVPTLPVSLLRDAVRRETARLSLRRAATAIAISPNGLRNFLSGSEPRSATRPPNVAQLIRLLGELSGDLSPQQTMQMGRDIAALLAEAYETRRLSAPRWAQELLRHYGREGKAARETRTAS